MYCCTGSWIGCGFRFIYFKLPLYRWICHCIGQLMSAVCVSVRLCFDSTIQYFTHCFLLFHVGIVNTVISVILFCPVFCLANCSPQDPYHPELGGSKDRGLTLCQSSERHPVWPPCWVSDPKAQVQRYSSLLQRSVPLGQRGHVAMVLCVLCTKCTLHSNHSLTRVIFQNTKRLLLQSGHFLTTYTRIA